MERQLWSAIIQTMNGQISIRIRMIISLIGQQAFQNPDHQSTIQMERRNSNVLEVFNKCLIL